MAMARAKLGTKIASGFGVLIIIALALGALAVYNMYRVEEGSRQLDQLHMPEVAISDDLETHTQLVLYAIRAYAYSHENQFLEQSHQEMRKVRQAIEEGQALAQKYPELVELRQQIGNAEAYANKYADLLKNTKALVATLEKSANTWTPRLNPTWAVVTSCCKPPR